MVLAEIGTAGVISAYFFSRHITSGYSLNVSDPIKGQSVQLSYYLCVFGCGLIFWLLVLLWAKLHEVAKLAKLITLITTLNLWGCLIAPFMKLPLLVRFLVLFQASSNLALLIIWAFLSAKAHTQQQQKSSPKPEAKFIKPSVKFIESSSPVQGIISSPSVKFIKSSPPVEFKSSRSSTTSVSGGPTRSLAPPAFNLISKIFSWNEIGQNSGFYGSNKDEELAARYDQNRGRSVYTLKERRRLLLDVYAVGGKVVDEAGGSGSGHGSGASGREENRGRYGGNDEGGGAGGGGDRGASGSGHGSGASGRGENSGGYWGHGRDEGATGSGHGSGASGRGENSGGDGGHGRDEGGTGSEHGSGAGGSGENRGGSEGGDRGRDGGGGDPESGGRETNTAFESSKITEMSLMLTAQTTAALIGFHLTTPSSSSKALLVVVLIVQLVAYLCGLTSILLSSNKPEDSKAAKIFADIGFVCTALGFILMVAMFVPWYLVLIAVLLFSVVWLIFFQNGLKTRAEKVWNYLFESAS